MAEHLKCNVYFSDPCCSWQRGLNENTNGLLQQYWPKSTDFKKASQSAVHNVIVNRNERSIKDLNHKTSAELMAKCMVTTAAYRLCRATVCQPVFCSVQLT
jgi:IS30 family transposase